MRRLSPLARRHRGDSYGNLDPADVTPDTRKIALPFLRDHGWVANPFLYSLLVTGLTEEALGERRGFKNSQQVVSRYVMRPTATLVASNRPLGKNQHGNSWPSPSSIETLLLRH